MQPDSLYVLHVYKAVQTDHSCPQRAFMPKVNKHVRHLEVSQQVDDPLLCLTMFLQLCLAWPGNLKS